MEQDEVPVQAIAPAPTDLYKGAKPQEIKSYRVVDLFSGCGGLSLGFDLADDGDIFKTVLAVDIEEAMVRAFNANHPCEGRLALARQIDISDFISDAEVLAVYLDHLAEVEGNRELRQRLNGLPVMRLDDFRARIIALDREFIQCIRDIRESALFLDAYRQLDSQVLNQTSVSGFHATLKLPLTSTSRTVDLGSIIWAADGRLLEAVPAKSGDTKAIALEKKIAKELTLLWKREVEALRTRSEGQGRGQLASSSGRIAAFVTFLNTKGMKALRDVWTEWRSKRDALRFHLFSNSLVLHALREIYEDGSRVAVVLGGPPCQGFSRIGRGKIRSLRDDRVHVHYDEDAGDVRNRLLHKYVLFVSALAPDAFLFENVRHFQSKVQTPAGAYLATEVLAEAIRNVSSNGPAYYVAQKIVNAADHLVPQKRERYFMIGIKAGVSDQTAPAWCLDITKHEPVPLRVALEGLPEPYFANDRSRETPSLTRVRRTSDDANVDAGAKFRAWIEQTASLGAGIESDKTDAHFARLPRRDDAALFELMGPGKRWMDYRADDSATIAELRSILEAVLEIVQATAHGVDRAPLTPANVRAVLQKVDGSLPLRLLLDSIDPLEGELQHHLLTPNYLSKRDGNHGDWLARLHPDEPCKTIVTHMGKDTYAYVHPTQPRTLSVREAARVQSFPDSFSLGVLSMVDAFRVIGNAVPPLLAAQFATRIARVLWTKDLREHSATTPYAVASVAAFG
jgi:DNA-cytosine methyltransferase